MPPGYDSGGRPQPVARRSVAVVSDDFLDEMIAERTSANAAFPAVLEAAVRRRLVDAERVADDGDGGLQ